MDLKKFFGNIRGKALIYILGAVGILILFFSAMDTGEEEIANEPEKLDYCNALETRLEEILPKITGVGRVDVMITAKNYGEIKLAKDTGDGVDETLVLNQKGGGEDTKIIEESYPEIQGVIIVAEGGKSDKVKGELTEAITALLNVETHKIKVFERDVINDF